MATAPKKKFPFDKSGAASASESASESTDSTESTDSASMEDDSESTDNPLLMWAKKKKGG